MRLWQPEGYAQVLRQPLAMPIGIYSLWFNLGRPLMFPVLQQTGEKDRHHFIIQRWRNLVEAFELQVRIG